MSQRVFKQKVGPGKGLRDGAELNHPPQAWKGRLRPSNTANTQEIAGLQPPVLWPLFVGDGGSLGNAEMLALPSSQQVRTN